MIKQCASGVHIAKLYAYTSLLSVSYTHLLKNSQAVSDGDVHWTTKNDHKLVWNNCARLLFILHMERQAGLTCYRHAEDLLRIVFWDIICINLYKINRVLILIRTYIIYFNIILRFTLNIKLFFFEGKKVKTLRSNAYKRLN